MKKNMVPPLASTQLRLPLPHSTPHSAATHTPYTDASMLADWILAAAPGFDGEEDGDHEFQALPPRMTAVSDKRKPGLTKQPCGCGATSTSRDCQK